MPEPQTPEVARPAAPAPRSITEEYDLGDVQHDAALDEPASGPVGAAAPAVEASSPPPAAPARPRNPDGTFAAAEGHQHSRQTRRLATDLGLSEEEIASTPPDMLDDLVYHLNKQQITLEREHARQATLQSGSERKPTTAPPSQDSGDSPLSPESASSDLGIDESQYDPGLVGVIKRQAAELKALKAEVQSVREFHQQAVRETAAQQCDRAFIKHEAILGKGARSELAADSAELARRRAVLSLVDQMPKGGTLEQKIDKAVGTLFGAAVAPTTPQPSRNGLPSREEQWRGGTVARPTQRGNASEPPGDKKAMQTAARIMRENGMVDDADLPPDAFPE